MCCNLSHPFVFNYVFYINLVKKLFSIFSSVFDLHFFVFEGLENLSFIVKMRLNVLF